MDIHKPKASHSPREFLIEIGTIICGILIALLLEQAVEWLHHDHQLAEAREAIREEVGRNATAAETANVGIQDMERAIAGSEGHRARPTLRSDSG